MHTTHAVVHRVKYPPGCSAHPCPAPLSNQDRAKFASQPELLVSSASQREHNPHLRVRFLKSGRPSTHKQNRVNAVKDPENNKNNSNYTESAGKLVV